MSLRRLLFLAFLIFPIWNAPAFAQGVVCPAGTLGCSAGGGGVTSGAAVPTCTAYSVITIDASGNLKCDPAAVVNGSVSTAGRSILTIKDTVASGQSMFDLTGTLNGTLSGETSGATISVTGDNDNQLQSGLKVSIVGANTSLTNLSAAIRGHFSGSANGTAGWFTAAPSNGSSNYALIGQIQGSGAQSSVGVVGWSENTSSNFSNHGGVFSGGGGGANPSRAYGITAMADSDAASGAIGGYFYLATASLGPSSTIPTPSGTAALVSDNGAVAANIFEARDNGTAVFTIADGGAVSMGASGFSNTVATDSHFMFGGAVNTFSGFINASVNTPDTLFFKVGSTSESVNMVESADSGFDFQNACTTGLGTAACTDPTFIVHSHNQDTGEFLSMAHDGKAGVIVGGNSTVLDGTIRLGGTVTLTESSATNVLTIPVAVSTGTGGEIMYTVEAKDATNTQVRRGSVRYAVANNSSGTETCGVYGVDNAATVNPAQTNDGSGAGAITSGTLTYAWTSDTTGTNQCVLKLNGVSSLTQTTFQIHYTVIQSGPGVPTGGD